MSRTATVVFRGEVVDVVIDKFYPADEETNSGAEIEWHFAHLSPQRHADLKLTEEEEETIYQQLCSIREQDD